MRKRIIAFVLAFMMVLGLLPGTGLENVLADNAGEEESSTDVTGLLVCDYLGNNEPAKQRSAGYGLIMEILFIFINMIQTEKIRSFIARKNWL